ncbi:hypothetical protein Tco_0871147 [Tanacetum coccineum]
MRTDVRATGRVGGLGLLDRTQRGSVCSLRQASKERVDSRKLIWAILRTYTLVMIRVCSSIWCERLYSALVYIRGKLFCPAIGSLSLYQLEACMREVSSKGSRALRKDTLGYTRDILWCDRGVDKPLATLQRLIYTEASTAWSSEVESYHHRDKLANSRVYGEWRCKDELVSMLCSNTRSSLCDNVDTARGSRRSRRHRICNESLAVISSLVECLRGSSDDYKVPVGARRRLCRAGGVCGASSVLSPIHRQRGGPGRFFETFSINISSRRSDCTVHEGDLSFIMHQHIDEISRSRVRVNVSGQWKDPSQAPPRPLLDLSQQCSPVIGL